MAFVTASGTKFEIGPVAADSVDTTAEFDALTGWTAVGGVESIGDFGDERAAVTFNEIGAGRVSKAKGSADAGTLALTTAYQVADPGQIALEAAIPNINNFGFRVTYPDGAIQYFRGLVMSKKRSIGTADNVIKRTFNIGINSPIYDKAAPSS